MRKLKKYFELAQTAHSVEYKLLPNTSVKYGKWVWDNFVTTKINNVKIKIGKEFDLLGDRWDFKIYVEDILVYYNGWIHKVPINMKKTIMGHVNTLYVWAKQADRDGVEESYKQLIKRKKHKEEQEKIDHHEKEKQRLLEIFK